MSALGENLRLAARVVAHGVRAGKRRLDAGARVALRPPGRSPDRLLIAPQDLRTCDPTRASEIYAGSFAFAGRTLETGGGSPFLAEAPSHDWAIALHGFGWLRHLRAADTTLTRSNARALVDEWIALKGGPDPASRASKAASRRLISWLCHSPLILDGAERPFYRRFLKSLARQTRQLTRSAAAAPDGAPRLTATAAVAYAGLCLSGEPRLLRNATRALTEELDRQILSDGGHAGRNPADLVDLLLDLIPLRQAFSARNVQPPPPLVTAIDRMAPMLRFFRHGDGDFAHFNGSGAVSADQVAAILAYDDARGLPVDDAPHSGYQRVSAGPALLLMDCGPPPPFEMSAHAHAGCLSFEFSSGTERLVVNCGAARLAGPDWRQAARSTPAHSTATIEGESSCRFAADGWRRLVGGRIVAGPKAVTVDRARDPRGVTISASHDGYADRFGIIHERRVTLLQDGLRLSGEDAFRRAPGAPGGRDRRVALRFHLHPSVRASARQDGQGVVLALPGGAGWAFEAPGFTVALEESVYLASSLGPRRGEQIVIHATAANAPKIAWTLERLPTDLPPRRRTTAAKEFDPLPL